MRSSAVNGARRTYACVIVGVVLLSAGTVVAGDAVDGGKQKEIYDTKADAGAQVREALARAERENHHVLLMYGGNWCSWCLKLHNLFEDNREIARTLLYHYELVLVDIGRMDRNMDVAKRFGADPKGQGVPFLTVLDSTGKPLVNQETGALEKGQVHDPDKVKAFLEKWKPKPRDAEQVLSEALKKAGPRRNACCCAWTLPGASGASEWRHSFLARRWPMSSQSISCTPASTSIA